LINGGRHEAVFDGYGVGGAGGGSGAVEGGAGDSSLEDEDGDDAAPLAFGDQLRAELLSSALQWSLKALGPDVDAEAIESEEVPQVDRAAEHAVIEHALGCFAPAERVDLAVSVLATHLGHDAPSAELCDLLRRNLFKVRVVLARGWPDQWVDVFRAEPVTLALSEALQDEKPGVRIDMIAQCAALLRDRHDSLDVAMVQNLCVRLLDCSETVACRAAYELAALLRALFDSFFEIQVRAAQADELASVSAVAEAVVQDLFHQLPIDGGAGAALMTVHQLSTVVMKSTTRRPISAERLVMMRLFFVSRMSATSRHVFMQRVVSPVMALRTIIDQLLALDRDIDDDDEENAGGKKATPSTSSS
jgi:hypothetical protein